MEAAVYAAVPSVPPVPTARVEPSVAVSVSELETDKVLPAVTERPVTLPAVKLDAVPVALVKTTALGVPRSGVTKVGEVAKTSAPLPVSSVTAEIKFADEGVARNVAMPVPSPETPVEIGNPVALVKVIADGVPRLGVTRVGEVEKTRLVDVVPVVPVAEER